MIDRDTGMFQPEKTIRMTESRLVRREKKGDLSLHVHFFV
jgi:hypothetical protein